MSVNRNYEDVFQEHTSQRAKRDLKTKPTLEQFLKLKDGEYMAESDKVLLKSGKLKTKFQETYMGIPVMDKTIVTETKKGKKTGMVVGSVFKDIKKDIKSVVPVLDVNDVINIATTENNVTLDNVTFDPQKDAKLFIYTEDNQLQESHAKLVYLISYVLVDDYGVRRPSFLIDANNGDIIKSWDGLTTTFRSEFKHNNKFHSHYKHNNNFGFGEYYYEGGNSDYDYNDDDDDDSYDYNDDDNDDDSDDSYDYNNDDGDDDNDSYDYNDDDGHDSYYDYNSHYSYNDKLVKVAGFGGNLKTGRYEYGKDYPFLEVLATSRTMCKLENDDLIVKNCKNTILSISSSCGEGAYSFICKEGTHDEGNGAYSPLNDAFFFANATLSMYKQWYDVTVFPSSKVIANVHLGNFDNAYWDGSHINFGDGKNMFPLTVADVVAHEVSHGFTEMNSGLINSEHSGALNEAFSDMAGKAVEYFLRGKVSWGIGGDAEKEEGAYLRRMDDPSIDGISIGNYADYRPDTNPYFGSGIFNKAFYHLSNTKGWDVRKAFHVFLIANKLYWTHNSHFTDERIWI